MTFAHYAGIVGAVLLALSLVWFGARGLRQPERTRAFIWPGIAPCSLLFGVVVLWGTAWIIVLRATDSRVNLNRWWFAPEGGGFWWGMLSPIMMTLFLAVCLLWWWPRNPSSFIRELKTSEGRRYILWDVGGSAVALVACVPGPALGIWLVLEFGPLPSGLEWLFGLSLVATACGGAIGAGWLYAKLVANPREKRFKQ